MAHGRTITNYQSCSGWLPRQDLNLKCLDQNQMCCQLHHGVTAELGDRITQARAVNIAMISVLSSVLSVPLEEHRASDGAECSLTRPEYRPFLGPEMSSQRPEKSHLGPQRSELDPLA
jgi:hypothetical protein